MYARVTSVQIDPAKLSELVAKMPAFKANAKATAGLVDTYVAWRADGLATITSIFETKAAADAAAAQAQAVWASIAGLLKGAPKAEGFDSVERLLG